MNDRRGFILIMVLWILLMLGLLAMGLSWIGSGELSLLRASAGKLRAYAAARAGVNYAQVKLVKHPSEADVLGRVGVDPGPGQKEIMFENIQLRDEQRFDIGYPGTYYVNQIKTEFMNGVSDEMGRFNINLIDSTESPAAFVFSQIVERFEPGTGRGLSEAIAAFKGVSGNGGAVRIFFFPEELFLVNGMTEPLFKFLKPLITVYPYQPGTFKLNLFTAPRDVVKAVLQGIADHAGLGMDTSRDAEAFLNCRDDLYLNKDKPVATCELPPYLSVYDDLGPFPSGLYRIRSTGMDIATKRHASIEAVVKVDAGKAGILSWRRE